MLFQYLEDKPPKWRSRFFTLLFEMDVHKTAVILTYCLTGVFLNRPTALSKLLSRRVGESNTWLGFPQFESSGPHLIASEWRLVPQEPYCRPCHSLIKSAPNPISQGVEHGQVSQGLDVLARPNLRSHGCPMGWRPRLAPSSKKLIDKHLNPTHVKPPPKNPEFKLPCRTIHPLVPELILLDLCPSSSRCFFPHVLTGISQSGVQT